MTEEQRQQLVRAIQEFGSTLKRGEPVESASHTLANAIIALIETREKKRMLMGTPESRGHR